MVQWFVNMCKVYGLGSNFRVPRVKDVSDLLNCQFSKSIMFAICLMGFRVTNFFSKLPHERNYISVLRCRGELYASEVF
uniref:Uncharacterized protein n=1 Tax=Kalanchoe fedtschenkoi TaxID=63787 RepID=A0A7N0ZX86_KALFE